jgi:membrane fusion protein (multidrug efflux system)
METAAQLGVVGTFKETPDRMLAEFYKRDPSGNIDAIFAQLLKDAPDVKQAEAKLGEAQANLHQAELNLAYCDVVADIDGVVTRRNVNPGNHVIAGEELMAVRSLTEIWVDANFKETQLAKLRIGQPVDLDVDMYGKNGGFAVVSPASRWEQAQRWPCCRPRTPPAISSRSCSVCQCESS